MGKVINFEGVSFLTKINLNVLLFHSEMQNITPFKKWGITTHVGWTYILDQNKNCVTNFNNKSLSP